jgi:hypothetical protein
MDCLHFFLGIAVTRDSSSMDLSQAKYAAEILDNAGMTTCKSAMTPVDTSPKLSASTGPPVANLAEYRSLIGALHYLTFTRPGITYAVQQVCLHMHDPCEQHLAAIKRILCYIKGMLSHGIQLHLSSPTPTPTRLAMSTLDVPCRVSASTSVTTSSHGLRSSNARSLVPALRLRTMLWLTLLPKLLGFANSSTSFIDHLL